VSGKKRITVDEDAWNEAMRKANQLRQVQRDLPGMLATVQQASQQQAARDRAAFEARQGELNSRLAALSSYAQQIEATTTQRINTATAAIMNEAKRANQNLRAETRQLIERQEQRFTAAMETERDARQRDFATLQQQIARQQAAQADVLATARTVTSDARVMRDAIDSTLPHERYVPGELARLTSRLAIAEANIAAGRGEAALAGAQELFLRLGELRSEVELRDAEWRAAHLTAVTVVTALVEQISGSEHIDVVDDDSGLSADLDVDFWSDGELSKIKAQADRLLARLADEAHPPSLDELAEMSERTVGSLDDSLSKTIALAQARQWASQVRVNVAEHVVEVLEGTTGYDLDGEPVFAGGDQRGAFYSKLRSADDSEIVIEVAPDESGKSCLIRVLSYESGTGSEHLRVARVHAIADALGAEGLPGTPSAEPGEPDPVYRDLARLRQRPAASAVPGRA
jgi:predicted transcriptional regulator